MRMFLPILAVCSTLLAGTAFGQDEPIPHAQDKPPGPALSPAEAMAKMTVPDGFTVELVAAEPDIVNPVAMTIDERGRFWITESLEYPRRDPGPGRDRIKVLEDTDADGTADKFTVFLDGLNIPSGIAVGHGGVWVANAPDILFVQDTDGDGKADRQEVVVTGFGRDDTHELPNSLTWGPDGWLYGLNGVFNPARVVYSPTNPNFREGQKPWEFTCAMFRIHPQTREFQVFCEGTSNPWGITFNDEGDAFISACVIDHLWHLTETGYYHRQGGPYPPFTWKIESITGHKHQKAAYCGIHWYDSDAYPEQYRRKFYMGNLHGSCINSDSIERRGSTYRAVLEPDFLSAHDAWFMPVVQKTGPDGCLYLLDWYDRYHCYQDANRDPGGIDRLKGRLYRIRYQDVPRAPVQNLADLTNTALTAELSSGNGWRRDIAQRLLTERLLSGRERDELVRELSVAVTKTPRTEKNLRALGVLIAADAVPADLLTAVLQSESDGLRAWGVRAVAMSKSVSREHAETVFSMRHDPSPAVRVQVAIASIRQPEIPAVPVLVSILAQAGDDPLAPRIVWQNLHPLLETQTAGFVAEVMKTEMPQPVIDLLPRAADRILSAPQPDTPAVAELVRILLRSEATEEAADRCLQLLTARVRSGEISGAAREELCSRLEESLRAASEQVTSRASTLSALELGTSLRIPAVVEKSKQLFHQAGTQDIRRRLLDALVTAETEQVEVFAEAALAQAATSDELRRIVQAIGRIGSEASVSILIRELPGLPEDVRPAVVESLTDRVSSATALMTMVADGRLPVSMINANQAAKMLNLKNDGLTDLVVKHWGVIRSDRDPARVRLIRQMRNTLRTRQGDPFAGRVVFKRVCGQCHKIYGEGAEVGPDITRNGRASFEQLLSNVFDPSLVIGASYQGTTVSTTDGRVISGLLAEDSPQRVVLKVQGDKLEVIARGDIDEIVPSKLSLMPEGLEKQLTPQEMLDLFAFITLDRPPEDKEARRLSGARIEPGESPYASDFPAMIEQLLPGYSTSKSGEGGIAVLEDYAGRPALRTHPVSRTEPCKLTTTSTLPAASKITLVVSVASHEHGNWVLSVNVNGKLRHESLVKRDDTGAWRDVEIDLSDLSGQSVTIELINSANDWSDEWGFWNAAEIVVE